MTRNLPAVLVLVLAAIVPQRAVAQITVQGNTIHELNAAPGGVQYGSIGITNTTAAPQVARVYLTDYFYFPDGTARFDPPGSLRRSNSAWVQLGASEVTIPPGATVPVPYTVRVPSNDSLVGSYWSMIMIEGASAGGASRAGGVALSAVVRYGVQLVTHLPKAGTRHMAVTSGKLVPGPDGDGVALRLEITNTGDRATRVEITTELYDSEGAVRARIQNSRGLTYPATGLIHKVQLGKLSPGTYKAVVVIDAEGSISGSQYTLKL